MGVVNRKINGHILWIWISEADLLDVLGYIRIWQDFRMDIKTYTLIWICSPGGPKDVFDINSYSKLSGVQTYILVSFEIYGYVHIVIVRLTIGKKPC